MAIIKQDFLDQIKAKHKYLIDNALNQLNTISERVEKIRKNENGKSRLGMFFQQNEFAYLIDVPPQNYYRMRKSKKDGGMDIALHHLVKISVYSGQSLDSLVFGGEPVSFAENNSHKSMAEERLQMIDILKKNISLLEDQNNNLKLKLEDCQKSMK